jgi:endonuclease/exonuclease/phosphatase family metal-dependent hydrolase
LPAPLLRHGERFERLPAAVGALDADVVLIQEAFTEKAHALAREAGYRYSAWGRDRSFLRFSSGLLILSKHPITATATMTFKACGGFDCFSRKGAQYARIEVPGFGPLDVFNTHLNANGHQWARAGQARELLSFVRRYSTGAPAIVGGDFNCEPSRLPASVVKHFGKLAATMPGEFTQDSLLNPYLKSSGPRRRIDYLFLLDGASSGWEAASSTLLFDGSQGSPVLSDHFGVRVSAGLLSFPRPNTSSPMVTKNEWMK